MATKSKMSILKDNLKQIMKEQDITPKQLSLKTGISQRLIMHFVYQENTSTSVDNLMSITEALGCELSIVSYIE